MNFMNKRSVFGFTIVATSIFLSSCEDDAPLKKKEYRPLRIEEAGYKRELMYNEASQVTKIVSESEMPDGEVITTVQEFQYDGEGKIVTSLIDNDRLYHYTWEENRVVKTEQAEKGIPVHRFIFSYHSDGRIREMLTYTYGNGSVQLKGKITYAFDAGGNISSVKEFSFQETAYMLESIYEYDRFDNFPSADSHFDFHALNPGLQLHKNNPGRMVSKNKNGIAFSIEDYVYEYNENNHPVKRESTITFLHIGSTGSYETHYFFEEI
jgi:hypothetical protein